MLMPSARQTKRIMEKSLLFGAICNIFGLHVVCRAAWAMSRTQRRRQGAVDRNKIG
jgi:hypothetical protein